MCIVDAGAPVSGFIPNDPNVTATYLSYSLNFLKALDISMQPTTSVGAVTDVHGPYSADPTSSKVRPAESSHAPALHHTFVLPLRRTRHPRLCTL